MNTNDSKICPNCTLPKAREEFHVETARKDKMSYRCRICQSARDKDRHTRERTKRLKQQKLWYALNAKERSQKAREWALQNPERKKATKRKNDLASYGLTVEDFEAMKQNQSGGCAICAGPPAGKYDIFVVDHDHKTGKVRGLLCSPCNMGLGLLKDDLWVLENAVQYLYRYLPSVSGS